MMPQNIVRKHCPQNVEIGCVDCSAILGRVVVAGGVVCCAAQGGRVEERPAHVSASLYRLGEYSGPR